MQVGVREEVSAVGGSRRRCGVSWAVPPTRVSPHSRQGRRAAIARDGPVRPARVPRREHGGHRRGGGRHSGPEHLPPLSEQSGPDGGDRPPSGGQACTSGREGVADVRPAFRPAALLVVAASPAPAAPTPALPLAAALMHEFDHIWRGSSAPARPICSTTGRTEQPYAPWRGRSTPARRPGTRDLRVFGVRRACHVPPRLRRHEQQPRPSPPPLGGVVSAHDSAHTGTAGVVLRGPRHDARPRQSGPAADSARLCGPVSEAAVGGEEGAADTGSEDHGRCGPDHRERPGPAPAEYGQASLATAAEIIVAAKAQLAGIATSPAVPERILFLTQRV